MLLVDSESEKTTWYGGSFGILVSADAMCRQICSQWPLGITAKSDHCSLLATMERDHIMITYYKYIYNVYKNINDCPPFSTSIDLHT